MKLILEVGDKVKLNKKFKSNDYACTIRKLDTVTIREVVNDLYLIKETDGMRCDDYWNIEDFEID